MAIGKESVLKDTPSGNVLNDEDALAFIIIIGSAVMHSANLNLDFCHRVFQATAECL
jgi:hypothetical protein